MDRVQATCFFLFQRRDHLSNILTKKIIQDKKLLNNLYLDQKTHCAVHFVQKNHHKNA